MPVPKVDLTLASEFEWKVDELVSAFGGDDDGVREDRRRVEQVQRDEKRQEAIVGGALLEGPQPSDSAISQDDIDAPFKSLG